MIDFNQPAILHDDGKRRCRWCGHDEQYIAYHDEEWGVPLRDERRLFEMLILEGAQAGLSWLTILRKRDNYRAAFDNFEVDRVAKYTERKIQSLLKNPGIVRNELKLRSAVTNAKLYREVQQEFGGFAPFLWAYVNDKPIQNKWKLLAEIPAKTPLSDQLSKDLKKRGFKFVGSTICYAYMQSVGLVDDHTTDCYRHGHCA